MPHIHDLIDFVVNAYIVHDEKILLIFHKKLQRWLPIGGHIELDEDPDEALIREIREECGLEVEVLAEKPVETFDQHKFLFRPSYLDIHKLNPDFRHRHVALSYFCLASSDKFVLSKDEHDNIRWFSATDLDDLKWGLGDEVKFLAKEALKQARK